MNFFKMLTSNYLINIGFLSCFMAQLIKTFLTFLSTKTLVTERLVGSGGMPSSHSALVCSLVVGMARKVGFESPEFALSLMFAVIVMYDAMGVRRAAGEQAKVLNTMIFGFLKVSFNQDDDDEDQISEVTNGLPSKALKEYIGHTPIEVLGGALLGILIAIIIPVI